MASNRATFPAVQAIGSARGQPAATSPSGGIVTTLIAAADTFACVAIPVTWNAKSTLPARASVQLTFWAKVRSFESSDQAVVRVSPDGVNWTDVMVFTSSQSDNAYHAYSIDLSGFLMTTNFRVAFDANMNSSKDYFYVDDIDIIGVR